MQGDSAALQHCRQKPEPPRPRGAVLHLCTLLPGEAKRAAVALPGCKAACWRSRGLPNWGGEDPQEGKVVRSRLSNAVLLQARYPSFRNLDRIGFRSAPIGACKLVHESFLGDPERDEMFPVSLCLGWTAAG